MSKRTYPYVIERRFFFHCCHCGKEMQQYGDKTINVDDRHTHVLIEPCECIPQKRIEILDKALIRIMADSDRGTAEIAIKARDEAGMHVYKPRRERSA